MSNLNKAHKILEETVNKLLEFRELYLGSNESYSLFREIVSLSFITHIEKKIKSSWFSQNIRIITYKGSHQRCPIKKRVLKNLVKFEGKYLCESLAQMFSCEFCEIFKSTYLIDQLRVTASAYTTCFNK